MDDLEDVLNDLNFDDSNDENACCLSMGSDEDSGGALGQLLMVEKQADGPDETGRDQPARLLAANQGRVPLAAKNQGPNVGLRSSAMNR